MKFYPVIIAVSALVSATSYAQAFTVSATTIPATVTTNNNLPGTLTGGGGSNVTGTIRSRATPWQLAAPALRGRKYNYVTGTGAYTYRAPKLASKVSFVWGSPDKPNLVQLFRGSTLLNSISTANPVYSAMMPRGNGYIGYVITIAMTSRNEMFDRIVFSSSASTFEFADVTVSPVPVPPAILMLGSALLGLGGFAWRRKILA